MIVQNGYAYIQIGLVLRLLRNVVATNTKAFVETSFDTLLEKLEEGNFQVTIAATIGDRFSEMQDAVKAVAKADDAIGEKVANAVRAEAAQLETVIFPESLIKKLYVLPNRRFNSDYLLNSPGALLGAGLFGKLELIAQQDVASAGRCLLFGEATASAFHILRATESVLKSYYFHHRKQKRLPRPMWGPMVDQLKAKTRNRPPNTLLSALDLIRTAYRNPTQHPEAQYEIIGAEDLFGVCLDAIGKMAAEL